MELRQALGRWERMLFGFVMGAAAAVLTIFLWHQAVGLLRVNAFERAVANQNLERLAELLDEQVALAERAFEDGRPLAMSEHLAFEFAPTLYRHHMRYARDLLERGEVSRFNQLRMATSFMVCDLSNESLAGLDLRDAQLSNSVLEATDLSGADLSRASFVQAEMPRAILAGARIDGTAFDLANLAAANLTRVAGRGPTFNQTVLAAASIQQVSELQGAVFASAILDDVNLYGSRLPGAVLDGASMQLASAVNADLSGVESMAGVDLTGANLTGARVAPDRMPRAWLSGVEGLDSRTARELVANGGVLEPEQVFELVDRRIVEGFRAQAEANDEIEPAAREAVLINWLKGYYLQ